LAKSQQKVRPKTAPRHAPTAFEKAMREMHRSSAPRPTVSGRWLLKAFAVAVVAAALCCWATLCLLFWQGSWQLLYHPSSVVKRTPASAGIRFDTIALAADETGRTRLTGWWIPADANVKFGRITVLFLHSQNGNLGDAVDSLAALHTIGVNVLAVDYRGYGQSLFARPSEARWREDAEYALNYLTGTRQIHAAQIVLDGDGLGANLALEVAAAHPELAGAILRDPIPDAANAIFSDPRAKLIPAHMLVRDRFDQAAATAALRIPALWVYRTSVTSKLDWQRYNQVFATIASMKSSVELSSPAHADSDEAAAISHWLIDLGDRTKAQ
jgi:pimeloyl-ACP methyl ester carboxylesterase